MFEFIELFEMDWSENCMLTNCFICTLKYVINCNILHCFISQYLHDIVSRLKYRKITVSWLGYCDNIVLLGLDYFATSVVNEMKPAVSTTYCCSLWGILCFRMFIYRVLFLALTSRCYWGFHGHYSREAEHLFQALESTYQKALQSHLKGSDSILSLPPSDRSSSSSQESLKWALHCWGPRTSIQQSVCVCVCVCVCELLLICLRGRKKRIVLVLP